MALARCGGGDNVKQYLYNKGDEFTAFTGGWGTTQYAWSGAGVGSLAPTLTKNALNMSWSQGSSRYGSIKMENAIDLTNYTRLAVHIKGNTLLASQSNNFACLTATNPASANFASTNLVYVSTMQGVGEIIVYFDVSALNSSYYFALSILTQSGYTSTGTIYKAWLE